MTSETHELIRQKMTGCNIWDSVDNFRIYTTEQFISEFGDRMPEDLISLLNENVTRLQRYFDDRILEPKQIKK